MSALLCAQNCWLTEIHFGAHFFVVCSSRCRLGVFDQSLTEVEINDIALYKMERHGDDNMRTTPRERENGSSKVFKNLPALPTQTITLSSYDFPGFYLCVTRLCYNERCGFSRASTLSKLREATFPYIGCGMCVCVVCARSSLWMHIAQAHSFYTLLHSSTLLCSAGAHFFLRRKTNQNKSFVI